ncbi:HlyD family type I secretion periplasmic adaptor subunit [Litorivita pollutaquae]|uniref:Membrane fusion protein (MFP) family protein n=2 Tax=Litorivita pollutaquae TaxID=2200892 RepID=A0A2V4NQU9_9RHOB|nr:HlyD family type I secretion periplasmic adaptor subunit [Litorivita pollutaquae]
MTAAKPGQRPAPKPRSAATKPAAQSAAPLLLGNGGAKAADDVPNWSARVPLMAGIITLAVLLLGFGTWATFTQISGAIIAGGRIEVDQNRQIVQHPDGGVVDAVLVKEGETVSAGTILLRLDDTRLRSQLAITEGQLYELMARRGRLEAERDGTKSAVFDPLLIRAGQANSNVAGLVSGQMRLLEARSKTEEQAREQLQKRRSQIGNQIDGLTAQSDALQRQLALIGEELASQKSLLDRGLAQSARVLGLQREEARLLGSVGDLAAQKAQAEGRVTEIDLEILKLGSQRREEAITRLRDLQYRELELAEQRRALMEQLSRLDITSPVSGVVYGLTVFAERSVIRAADPLMYIVPQDRPLVVQAQIEPIHIDQIFVGQDVTLRISALDQRTTPELMGRVVHISADAFQDDATRQSYYRAEIVISEGEQAKLPAGSPLIPGMPVEAFIRTADRTPIAYLVKPFTDYFTKAFRE